MDHPGHRVDQETICCSLCLDLLNDPVTTACGHKYCRSCIKDHWDTEDQRRVYSCPQCRQTFWLRPVLKINTMLADLVEDMKKTGLQAAPADHCYAGPEDVACDVCTGRKLKAQKSCLQCLASFCEEDLQTHFHSEPLKSHGAWTNISETVTQVDVLLSESEPRTRAEFFRYSRDITLDPNTAYRRLLLSDGNRKVTSVFPGQSYPDHPDRFTDCCQVLSEESLTGRCYWEVELTGGVCVAVSYMTIRRTGRSNECEFGRNNKSWSLNCYRDRYDFWYNKIPTFVSGPWSSRVGVYLDHRAGILSFYRVSETMTLIHRVQTTFTQPLRVGLGIFFHYAGLSAELCKLK